MKGIISDFLARHQNPYNMVLHVIGIPLTIIGLVHLFRKKWLMALAYIFTGFLLQYLGHTLFEHNQMGEYVLIMNLIRKITG